MDILIDELGNNFSGPILFNYVWWILSKAQQRGITRLYFLARDGYLLLRIAKLFCEKFSISIECQYLYCSRKSLRMPSYHLIGTEAYELLLLGGYQVSLSSIMKRLNLDTAQQQEVLKESKLKHYDPERLLSAVELTEVKKKIKRSPTFFSIMREKSLEAYTNTLGYLRQEGMFDNETIAIVDSGWTGSMQRSIRQLMQSAGFTGKIVGFYFGMYAVPKDEDGEYLTWYFNAEGKTMDKVFFCNNLFECLLSAPHGMTAEYELGANGYRPVFLQNQNSIDKSHINRQIASIINYTHQKLGTISFDEFDNKLHDLKLDTSKRLYRYMVRPTQEEVLFYGSFQFCDDVTEGYHSYLASSEQMEQIRQYLLWSRVKRKLFRQQGKAILPELYWPYGNIAFLPCWKQPWYRWNVYLWEFLKYDLKKWKSVSRKQKNCNGIRDSDK